MLRQLLQDLPQRIIGAGPAPLEGVIQLPARDACPLEVVRALRQRAGIGTCLLYTSDAAAKA